MIKLHAAHALPPAPTIDAAETRRVATELAGLLRRVIPGSPAEAVLIQARRELESLARSAEAAVSPPRAKAAA